MPDTARRCAVYARISVSHETSVSIDRQIEAARQYAEQRGWPVVAVFRDDGVSASKNAPEDRAGWRTLMESEQPWEVVVVWKLDRLVRRIVHFWDTHRWLEENDRSLVSVMDNLDMTTTIGQMVAGILAGAAQLEADATSDRVAGARQHLIGAGRVVGGKVPFGWVSVRNPDGPGKVLAQDSARVGHVREMARRARRGDTLYAIQQWLNAEGVPGPSWRGVPFAWTNWGYSSVERTLRHPVLAGMTPFNPGNEGKTRGAEVLRGDDGLPVVDGRVAIMSQAEWRAMVAVLDGRDSPQARPRAMKTTTSALLSGLVRCGEHDEPVRMHRGTTQGRPGYACRFCFMTVSNFEDVVVEEFLARLGDMPRMRMVEKVHEGGEAVLPEIEQRLDELETLIRRAGSREARREHRDQQEALLDLRDEKRAEPRTVTYRQEGTDRTFAEDWSAAQGVEARREVLDDAVVSVTVTRGAPGRRTRDQLLARLAFEWQPMGQVEPPSDEELAAWAAS